MSNKYWKHPQHGHVYGLEINTPLLRFAWPSLIKPKDAPPPKPGETQGAPRYELTGIMLLSDPATAPFLAEIKAMTDEMLVIFNQGRPAKLALDDSSLCTVGNDFLAKGDNAEKYPYYKDARVLIARNTKPFLCFDRSRNELTPDKVLGGMQGVMRITPMITAHGISYKLVAVQVVQDDGIRFGSFNKDTKSAFNDWDAAANAANPVVPATPEAASAAPTPQVQEAASIAATPAQAQELLKATTGKEDALNLL